MVTFFVLAHPIIAYTKIPHEKVILLYYYSLHFLACNKLY